MKLSDLIKKQTTTTLDKAANKLAAQKSMAQKTASGTKTSTTVKPTGAAKTVTSKVTSPKNTTSQKSTQSKTNTQKTVGLAKTAISKATSNKTNTTVKPTGLANTNAQSTRSKTNTLKPLTTFNPAVTQKIDTAAQSASPARATDKSLTFGKLNTLKQSGAIPSAKASTSVSTVKPLSLSDTSGADSLLEPSVPISQITAENEKNTQGGTKISTLISEQHSALGNPFEQKKTEKSSGETGIVGSLAKQKHEREQNGALTINTQNTPTWYKQATAGIETTADEVANVSSPVTQQQDTAESAAGTTVVKDYLAGMTAAEKTQALMPVIEKNQYYQKGKAALEKNISDQKVTAAALDLEITAAQGKPWMEDELEDLKTKRRQALMQQYYAQDRLNSFADETRVLLTENGLVTGTVTPEERIRYDVDQQGKSEGWFANFEAGLNMLGTTGYQVADSTKRDAATLFITAASAVSGEDSAIDYISKHEDQKAIFARAYSPTEDLSDYSGSFGSEAADTAQKIIQSAAESIKTMAMSAGIGTLGAGAASGTVLDSITRIFQYANSGYQAAAQAARDATNNGASATRAAQAGLFSGIANAYLEQKGVDTLLGTAAGTSAKLATGAAQKFTSSKLGGKVIESLSAGGLKKAVDALKSVKNTAVYQWGLDVVKSFVSESIEEGAEDAVGNVIAKAVYDEDMPWSGEGGVFDWETIKQDGALGGAMGVAFTMIAAAAMPGKYRAKLLAQDAIETVQDGGKLNADVINAMTVALNEEIRQTETTVSDVDAHNAVWQDAAQAPESLSGWRAIAQKAEGLQSTLETARQGLSDMVYRIRTGDLDVTTEQGAQWYQETMNLFKQTKQQFEEAALQNIAARELYYADEDAYVAEQKGKQVTSEERQSEIREAVNELEQAGELDSDKLQSPETASKIRELDSEIMNRDALAGEVEQARADEANAPSPAEQLEAKQTRMEKAEMYSEAKQRVEERKQALKDSVRSDAQEVLDARMQAAREGVGISDRYTDMTNEWLESESTRLEKRIAALQEQMKSAKGKQYRGLKKRIESMRQIVSDMQTELEVRQTVYQSKVYLTADQRAEAQTRAAAEAQTQTEAQPMVGTQAEAQTEAQPMVETQAETQTEAQPMVETQAETQTEAQAAAETQPETRQPKKNPSIYRNGVKIYDGETDTMLRSDIAAESAKTIQFDGVSDSDLISEYYALNDEAAGMPMEGMELDGSAELSKQQQQSETRLQEISARQEDILGELDRRGVDLFAANAQTDTQTQTEAQPVAETQTQTQTEAQTAQNTAQVETDEETELARMNEEAARAAAEDRRTHEASGQERLEELRQERTRRESKEAREKAKRDAKLHQAQQLIEEINGADDRELILNEKYLKKRMAEIDNETGDSKEGNTGSDIENMRNERQQIGEALSAISKEINRRIALRAASMQTFKEEMTKEKKSVRDSIYESDKERIQANQQAGLAQIEKLKMQRDSKLPWRVTDTISQREAAQLFGGTDAAGKSIESQLNDNRKKLAEMEQKSALLDSCVEDMESSIALLENRLNGEDIQNMDAEELRNRLRMRDEIAQLKGAIDKASGVRKQIDTTIRYLNAHSGDTVLESMQAGRLPQQMLERVMGIVDKLDTPALGSISLNMNTATRVFDTLFGEYAPVMRAIYTDPIAQHEAARQRYIGGLRERIAALKLDKYESDLVQRVGEGLMTPDQLAEAIDAKHEKRGTRLKDGSGEWTIKQGQDVNAQTDTEADADGWGSKADEVKRIMHAADVFRDIYEDLYNRVNDAYVRNGYTSLGHIEKYLPHFQNGDTSMLGKMAKALGFENKNYSLPTSIDGLTETFSPGTKYNPHAEHRYGKNTDFDAVEGFENYIDSATQAAFLTDDIKRLRQLESAIRSGEKDGTLTSRLSQGKTDGSFGTFAKWTHEYANLVAGKKAALDRGVENAVGRKLYQVLDIIRSRRGAGAVAGNLSSAITNITPVAQVIAEHPIATFKAMGSMVMDLMSEGSSGIPQSDFLSRRFASDRLGGGTLKKVENAASFAFTMCDEFASNIVTRANYYAYLDAGMDSEAAMRSADASSARMMADRSLGQMPNAYKSSLFMSTFGQFQLEVDNQLRYTFKDIPKSTSLARAGGICIMLSVMQYLTNAAFKAIRGRDVMADPIQTGMGAVEDFQKAYEESGGNVWSSLWTAGNTVWEGIADALPYWNNGKIGQSLVSSISDMVGDITSAAEAGNDADKWNTVIWSLMDFVTFGGQIRKTYQGLGSLMETGCYNAKGQLMYPVDSTDTWTRLQALMFGKSATDYAVKYWDEGRDPLSTANTETYHRLVSEGMSPGEAYETVYDYQMMGVYKKKRDAAVANGDTQLQAYYESLYQDKLAGVDYNTLVVPESLQSEVSKAYCTMLETAYRESGNSKDFTPRWYTGEFTKDGIERKYTPESIEKLQPVYSERLNALMSQYEDTWGDMSEVDRKAAYVSAISAAKKYAKEYGFEQGYEYVDKSDYSGLGYTAPGDTSDTSYETPVGLTNPIFDTVSALSGNGGELAASAMNALTGNPQIDKAADTETQPTESGIAVSAEDLAAAADVGATDAAGTTESGNGYSNGYSGGYRRGSSSRRSSSRRSSSGRSSSGGSSSDSAVAINVTPETTVSIPYHRTRLYEAFGEGYNPFPLTNSFEWNGQAVTLDSEQMDSFSQLYDIYMDMAMREQGEGWDAATEEQKREMYKAMDEQARNQAMQHISELM